MASSKTAVQLAELLAAVEILREKVSQIEVSKKEEIKEVVLSDVRWNSTFKWKTKLYRRIRPTSFLLNSTLIQENLARGNVLVLDEAQGTCYFVSGNTVIDKEGK